MRGGCGGGGGWLEACAVVDKCLHPANTIGSRRRASGGGERTRTHTNTSPFNPLQAPQDPRCARGHFRVVQFCSPKMLELAPPGCPPCRCRAWIACAAAAHGTVSERCPTSMDSAGDDGHLQMAVLREESAADRALEWAQTLRAAPTVPRIRAAAKGRKGDGSSGGGKDGEGDGKDGSLPRWTDSM